MSDQKEQYPECMNKLRVQGGPYPRTCHECGLGPCKTLYSWQAEKPPQQEVPRYEKPEGVSPMVINIGAQSYEVPIRVHTCIVGLRLQVEALNGVNEAYRSTYKEQQAQIDLLKRRLRGMQEMADSLAKKFKVA